MSTTLKSLTLHPDRLEVVLESTPDSIGLAYGVQSRDIDGNELDSNNDTTAAISTISLTDPNSTSPDYVGHTFVLHYGDESGQQFEARFRVESDGTTVAVGTGEGVKFFAQQQYRTAGDKIGTIRGSGGSEAEAIAELQAKKGLLHTSNTLIGVPTVNRELTPDEQTAYDAVAQVGGQVAAAAIIRMTLALPNNRRRNLTVRVPYVGTAIKGNPLDNDIDGTNPAVQNFVAAYRDGDNNGGYQFRSGYFK